MINFHQGIDSLRDAEKLIESYIKDRLVEKVANMSQEELVDKHFTVIQPHIPDTVEGIESAIDKFIKKYENKGDELLEYLDILDFENSNLVKYLSDNITYKKLENGDIEVLFTSKEVEDVVKNYLKSLESEALNNYEIFGTVVTKEQAKKNREWWIDSRSKKIKEDLSIYGLVSYSRDSKYALQQVVKIKVESLNSMGGIEMEEEFRKNSLERITKRVTNYIQEYPLVVKAYKKGWEMDINNYNSDSITKEIKSIFLAIIKRPNSRS